MDLTIIVPVYKGNKYVDGLIGMAERNYAYARSKGMDIDVQLLFVNDYPDEPIKTEKLNDSPIDIDIYVNPHNEGIHKSRINGLTAAKSDFILFLDQDDMIEDICVYSQCSKIGDADLVIANGIKMSGDKKRPIYRSLKKQQLALNEKIFLYAANQIVSPGHCLLRKSSIPDDWYHYIIEQNGGDDLFLWLLMFETGRKLVINEDKVYVHIDTGENVSGNTSVMLRSAENVIRLSRKCGKIPEKKIKIYEKRIKFLDKLDIGSKPQKLLACIANADICLYKLYAYYR